MNLKSNVYLASQYFIGTDYKEAASHEISFEINSVKGYLTTNVYQLLISFDSKIDVKYIKESSDLNNDVFNGFIEEEYKNTKYIYDNFKSKHEVYVVKPIAYYEKFKLFFMDGIEGERLDKLVLKLLLFKRKDELLKIVALCKKWLVVFQEISYKDFYKNIEFNFVESEKAKIKHLHMRSLENCDKSSVKSINHIFNEAYALANKVNIAQSEFSFKHNDFAPWNILFNKEAITVYDFADINVDYKFYDLMYFVHSLGKLTAKVPFSNKMFDLMRAEMLEGAGISRDTESYYTVYFYLQDIALLLSKIKQGGIRSIYYKYRYRAAFKIITKYLDEA